ncbi:hypothetical protein JXA56_00765 [Candidatus Micrarchaeota archaeon]|nr:hypothetical protein [Candidatus Micrarchaeota archaeon]
MQTLRSLSLLPKKEPFKGIAPLTDRPKQKVLLFDTCYVISLAKSGYPIEKSLEKLKQKGNVPVTTTQVMEELENIASSRRKDNGEPVLTSRQMCEIRTCTYNGILNVFSVEISDMLRKTAKKLLRKHSQKNNERVGEGELSLFALSHKLGLASISWEIKSNDSDVQALVA